MSEAALDLPDRFRRDRERRRVGASLVVAAAIWALALPLAALWKFAPQRPEERSMNPMFIELEPPPNPQPARREELSSTAPESEDAEALASSPGAVAAAPAASPAPANRAQASASASPAASREEAAATATLRPDPSAPLTRRAIAPAGGSSRGSAASVDPFAPLSEDALRTEAPNAPIVADAAEPAPSSGTAARQAAAAPSDERQDRTLADLERSLASDGGFASGTARSASPSSSGTPAPRSVLSAGGGDVVGGIDFGGTDARDLFGSRKIRIPDKLLAGQPRDLSTTVSFTVESGGTVLPGSIRFDPPLPPAIEDVLRAHFASWIFQAAASDGQAVFRYSIKVR